MSGLPGDFRRFKKHFSRETPGRKDPPEKAKFGRDNRKVFLCSGERVEIAEVSFVQLWVWRVCVYVCYVSPVITCKETLPSVVCPVE